MEFNRRQFLQSLAASVAALGLVQSTSLAKVLTGDVLTEPEIVWHTEHLLRQFTAELAKRISAKIGPLRLVQASQIGVDGLQHQFNLTIPDLKPTESGSEFEARFVRPAVEAFVDRLRQHHVTTCGVLPYDLPGAESLIVVSKRRGIALRAIRQYAIEYDCYLTRFDMLVG